MILVSCAPPASVKIDELLNEGNSLVHCIHNHDRKINFTYVVERSELYIIHETLSVYKFLTPQNREIYLNNYEMENYKCEKVE